MAETWPVSLQQKFNSSNFDLKFGNTLVRSDVDVGLAKVRSRYTDAIDIYTSSIDLEIDDFETFYDFYKTTLNNGSKTFDFDNPLTNTTDEFRFVAPPEIRPMGGRIFKVSFSWERIP
jgi:hypothetical protein